MDENQVEVIKILFSNVGEHPIFVSIILCLILIIFFLVWFVKNHKEIKIAFSSEGERIAFENKIKEVMKNDIKCLNDRVEKIERLKIEVELAKINTSLSYIQSMIETLINKAK